jgi:hypothetical protein
MQRGDMMAEVVLRGEGDTEIGGFGGVHACYGCDGSWSFRLRSFDYFLPMH